MLKNKKPIEKLLIFLLFFVFLFPSFVLAQATSSPKEEPQNSYNPSQEAIVELSVKNFYDDKINKFDFYFTLISIFLAIVTIFSVFFTVVYYLSIRGKAETEIKQIKILAKEEREKLEKSYKIKLTKYKIDFKQDIDKINKIAVETKKYNEFHYYYATGIYSLSVGKADRDYLNSINWLKIALNNAINNKQKSSCYFNIAKAYTMIYEYSQITKEKIKNLKLAVEFYTKARDEDKAEPSAWFNIVNAKLKIISLGEKNEIAEAIRIVKEGLDNFKNLNNTDAVNDMNIFLKEINKIK